jgi:hypothetical protein
MLANWPPRALPARLVVDFAKRTTCFLIGGSQGLAAIGPVGAAPRPKDWPRTPIRSGRRLI